MNRTRRQLRAMMRRLRAFTLLEVMVAVTIFALVSLVVFAVFSAAIRSVRTGDSEIESIARSRFVMDTMSRDISNIFFRDETSYNQLITRMVEEMERQRLIAEQSGNWEDFYNAYGNPSDKNPRANASVGNPYEKGRVIDVQLQGKDGGDSDQLTFASHQPFEVGGIYRPLGIHRVTYSLKGDVLVRLSESVEAAPRNIFGEAQEKPAPPQVIPLARPVKRFNLTYLFWYDNQWYETDSWNSTNRQIRNGRFILGDYKNEQSVRGDDTQLQPGDPGWNEYINDQQSEPLDRLPAAIRLSLTLADPENEKRTASFERIFRVPGAEETYVPFVDLTEEQRENEQVLRDRKYQPVYPGALEKY